MDYYLLSNDPYTNAMMTLIAVCVVFLVGLRIFEIWLDVSLSRDVAEYYRQRLAAHEHRIEDLGTQIGNIWQRLEKIENKHL